MQRLYICGQVYETDYCRTRRAPVCRWIGNMAFLRWTRFKLLRWTWCRMVILLVIMLVSLQLVHITLLGRLEAKKSEVRKFQQEKQLKDSSNKLVQAMQEVIQETQIVDSSGEYKLVNFFLEAEGKPKSRNDVALVTHGTVNRLHHIAELSERWRGPMSVAVFTPEYDTILAMELILRLYQCVPSIRQNVSIHLVFPLTHPPKTIPSTISQQDYSCGSGTAFYIEKMPTSKNYALGRLKYPNNLLRNLALNNARTEYVMVVDIDMLPSANLHEEFVTFAIQHSLKADNSVLDHKTVFVVPAFEIQNNVPIPQDKSKLLEQWSQRLVRPFYQELCWKCQRQTDYEAWRNLTLSPFQVGYEVGWKDPWEPFYIAARSVPLYDERFKQYGFNRISQVSPQCALDHPFHLRLY